MANTLIDLLTYCTPSARRLARLQKLEREVEEASFELAKRAYVTRLTLLPPPEREDELPAQEPCSAP